MIEPPSSVDWDALTARTLDGIERSGERFRPTTFWSPGLRQLVDDLETHGLSSFKSWPAAAFWFYPRYGNGLRPTTVTRLYEHATRLNPAVRKPWFMRALDGSQSARRDFDVVRLAWDQSRWPFDLEGLGESGVGSPPEVHHLTGSRTVGWTRPYLNYLLCLAALSRHVDTPPRTFLEIGGGYGVLGEIVMSRDPEARYVNLDIPPLLTVASYYLRTLFGGRVAVYDARMADTGRVVVPDSACLPNWRIGDLDGTFDVFVNSFSFQEMEPEIVSHYVDEVAARKVSFVVSLNSRRGKPRAADRGDIGVLEPVTSDRIVALFETRGYRLLGRYGDPLIQSNGELTILARGDASSRPAVPLAPRAGGPIVDHRLPQPAPAERLPVAAKPPTSVRRIVRAILPASVRRRLRSLRERIR